MKFLSSPTYSVMINGGVHGFFQGGRELRLGVGKKIRNRKLNREIEKIEPDNWLTEQIFQKNQFG